MEINRAFTRIEEGEIHYRYSGNESNETIYMIHSSPASSVILLPLMGELNTHFHAIAPDTLGFGDSAPPDHDLPSSVDYAESVIRVMNRLNLKKTVFNK